MSDRRLVLVRHGITDWNREGRFQGHLDPPLSEDGRLEATRVATRVAADARLRPERVVSSSLVRAFETAERIADAAGCPLEADARLIEVGQGEWEGRTHDELAISDAARYAEWRSASGERLPPGGETIEAVALRLRDALAALAGGPWPTVVVSHGGVLRVLAGLLLDLDVVRAWALDVDNASIGAVVGDGSDWRLERWNDTRHLLGRQPTHGDEAEGRPLAL